MDINEHMKPNSLVRYAFLWSLARLVIAAGSLFFGAVPIAYKIAGSLAASLLPLFWIVSGAAVAYLVYQWHAGGQKVFGGSGQKDTIAFWVMVVSGLNLGYAAIGHNIGMYLVWDATSMDVTNLLFKATAVGYIVVAYYLWKRWNESNQNLFGEKSASAKSEVPEGAASQTSEPIIQTEEKREE